MSSNKNNYLFPVSVVLFFVVVASFIVAFVAKQPQHNTLPSTDLLTNVENDDRYSGLLDSSVVSGQTLLVQFTQEFHRLPLDRQRDISEGLGLRLINTFHRVGDVSVVELMANAQDIQNNVHDLQSSQWVSNVELDYLVYADTATSRRAPVGTVPVGVGLPWGLHNSGQAGGLYDADIDAPEAWDKYLNHRTSNPQANHAEVIVAILDSGLDINHSAVADSLWNRGQTVPEDSVWNACTTQSVSVHHGTQVASVIADVNRYSSVKLLPLNVLCDNGTGSHAKVLAGLEYILELREQNIPVVTANLSWGNDYKSQLLEGALQRVSQAGVQLVVSAGNQGRNLDKQARYPAVYSVSGMLTVAASTRTDELAENSNHGVQYVDLSAPGVDIPVAVAGGGYQHASGTSLAAAYVSGASALLSSMKPELSPKQRKSAIVAGVDQSAQLANKVITRGRLNASQALGDFHGLASYDSDLSLGVLPQAESLVSRLFDKTETVKTDDNDDVGSAHSLELDISSKHIVMRFSKLYRDHSLGERQALLRPFGVTIIKDYPYAGGTALLEIDDAPQAAPGKLPEGETRVSVYQRVDKVIDLLNGSGLVEYAEYDGVVRAASTPDDTYYDRQWGLQKIQIEQAWDYVEQNNASPSEIVIGVFDTGIDYNHADLAPHMWVNPGEIAGDGIDNDGNGYVDDVYGWDVSGNDSDPIDEDYHGTHVAGVIGAVRNNGQGIAGITPYVKLMAIKSLDENRQGFVSYSIEALNYVNLMKQQHGVNIRVTNNSWLFDEYSQALKDAIEVAGQNDILFVTSAGNGGSDNIGDDLDQTPLYPASFDLDNIIVVAATESDDTLGFFSNYGQTSVDIAAPGRSILSALLGGGYRFVSGTSVAAPQVTGTLGLLLSLDDSLTALQAKARLLSGGEMLDSLTGKVVSASRLNALGTLSPPILEFDITNFSTTVTEGDTYSFNVRANQAIPLGEELAITFTQVSGDDLLLVESGSAITLDSSNWDQWQQVTVRADEDDDFFNNEAVFQFNTPNQFIQRFFFTLRDNDLVGAEICDSVTEISIVECQVLVDLYQQTDGNNWQDNTGWLTTNTPCSWYGITCSGSRVYQIELNNNGLSGEVPTRLNTLPGLTFLRLGNNQLTGEIPVELGLITNLYELSLGGNQLSGIIPDALSDLAYLRTLNLDDNQLTGTIPLSLTTMENIGWLNLSGNQLTGSIPAQLANASTLYSLLLESNQLSGEIPPELGNLTDLYNLGLQYNQLSGEIPSELYNLVNLSYFQLSSNFLTGEIDPAVGNLAQVYSLGFGENRLSGSIPAEMGNLPNISSLHLSYNQFRGEVPAQIANIRNASVIFMSFNALESSDPAVLSVLTSDFDQTQTVPPENVSLTLENGVPVLRWDIVAFRNQGGEYIISYADTEGGPYTVLGQTDSKSDDSFIVTGIERPLERIYVVQSHTPAHTFQKNDIVSRYSGEVVADLDNTRIPTVVAPANLTVEAEGIATSVALGTATATDSLDGALVAVADDTGPFALGTHTITWSATNSLGNTGTATQTITVRDTTAPVLTVPVNLTLEASGTLTNFSPDALTATDIVDGVLTATPSPAGPFEVGTHIVTWTVTDSAGNSVELEQTVIVEDTVAPVLVAPANMTVEATALETSVVLPSVTALDAVSGTVTATADNIGPFTLGTHTINWTATDAAGNAATVAQQIIIQDTTAPDIVAPAVVAEVSRSGQAEQVMLEVPTVNDIFPVSISNDAVFSQGRPVTLPIGTTTVIWTAVDSSGNTATFQQQVELSQPESAELLSPIAGGSLPIGSVDFSWSEVSGANYSLEVGTEKGENNIFSGSISSDTEQRVIEVPSTSSAIYVRLKTYRNGLVSFNDYVFNAPQNAFYSNHSGQIACYKTDDDYTYEYGDAGDVVVIVNPDNDSLSLLKVTRDPQTFELEIDVSNDFYNFNDSKPTSITRIGDYLAVTYPESGKLRFISHNYGLGVVSWTDWILPFYYNEVPIASVAHGKYLYIALYGTGEVIKYDIAIREIVARLSVGEKPKAMALTSDGSRLLVTRFISGGDYGEVYDINTADLTFRDPQNPSIKLHQVWVPDSSTHGTGVPNYLRSIAIGPNDEYAYITANKVNVERGEYLSGQPLTAENTIRPMIGVIDLVNHRDANIDPLTAQGTIDLGQAADPAGITYLADGVTRAHTLQGSNRIEFVNTQTDQVLSLAAGYGPQSLCSTLNTLYVKNYTGRSVTVIDTAVYMSTGESPEVQEIVTVPAEDEVLSDQRLQGFRLFYQANTSVSPSAYFSCASCHDEGGHDGMTWDFTQMGEGVRNTLSLRGANGSRLGVFNWSGNYDQIQDVEQQLEHMHGADGFILGQTFSGQSPLAYDTSGISDDLDAVAAYVGGLGKSSVLRSPYTCHWGDVDCSRAYGSGGWRFVDHCVACHQRDFASRYNQFSDGQLYDVGTITEASGQRNGQSLTGIRTPTLIELWDSAPYFHDGSAATLEEVLETPGHDFGLSEEKKSHLLLYLRNLDRNHYSDDPVP